MTAGRCLLFRGEQCRTHKSRYQVPIAELAERWTELPQVSDESRSFFRVHTGYFSNIPKCIKAEFIASWACSQSSVVSSSKQPVLPYTFEAINVLLESLHCRGKSCLLQWIPAHVNIEGNECQKAKEGRNDDQLCPTITLADANTVANYRLLPHRYKKTLIVDFDCSRNLTSIIARPRTGHFKGIKILSDKTRTYIPCKNCTEAQLTPDHILECPALTPHIIRLGMVPLASELREVFYSDDAPRLAEAVQRAHDII
ncbi:RNase H domain-containing protein [Trichonephila clavipes]|nr:RNase H domain-containing protein [Trichonephila clavipes]